MAYNTRDDTVFMLCSCVKDTPPDQLRDYNCLPVSYISTDIVHPIENNSLHKNVMIQQTNEIINIKLPFSDLVCVF